MSSHTSWNLSQVHLQYVVHTLGITENGSVSTHGITHIHVLAQQLKAKVADF